MNQSGYNLLLSPKHRYPTSQKERRRKQVEFHLLAKLLREFFAKLEGDGGTLQLFRAKDAHCLVSQKSIGASFDSDDSFD